MEVIALVVLFVIGIFLATGFLSIMSADRVSTRLARSWGIYAAQHQYAFTTGQTPERAFRIRGSREGLDFLLETDTEGRLVTRLVAYTSSPPVSRVVATLGRGRGDDSKGSKAPTGDEHFDRVFDVRASEAPAVETVLRPTVRMALQRFPTPMIGAGLRLVVDGDKVILEWAGGEVDPNQIDAAHAIVRELCCSPSA